MEKAGPEDPSSFLNQGDSEHCRAGLGLGGVSLEAVVMADLAQGRIQKGRTRDQGCSE